MKRATTDIPEQKSNEDHMMDGYQGVVFGRGSLASAFSHGTGLFFKKLNDLEVSPAGSGRSLGCTFKFAAYENDATLAERVGYLRKKFYGKAAIVLKANSYESNGMQFIEFKFRERDLNAVRDVILSIDESTRSGTVHQRAKQFAKPEIKFAA